MSCDQDLDELMSSFIVFIRGFRPPTMTTRKYSNTFSHVPWSITCMKKALIYIFYVSYESSKGGT